MGCRRARVVQIGARILGLCDGAGPGIHVPDAVRDAGSARYEPPFPSERITCVGAAGGFIDEPWRAVQQLLIGRYVGGEPRDLASRLDYLLRGDGRQLASSFLTDEQRGGLVRLWAAVSQAEHARAAMPTWLADVERGGFDPNRIASSLFGSGVSGARSGAINEARAAKRSSVRVRRNGRPYGRQPCSVSRARRTRA